MNTYLMKKTMIETAVDQGLKLIEEDPKRSVRRLADLGKQFSRSRFQNVIFTFVQDLLRNENSPYYTMIENLLQNADHDALKKFGINFGYTAWTYGASKIRDAQQELGCCIPWTIMLRYDPADAEGLTMDRMEQLFREGQELGIYAWLIRESSDRTDSYALLELLERYKECAFIWFRKSGRLTAAQVQMLRLCQGTVVSLPIDDPETFLTVSLLREQKIPFSLYREYETDEFSNDRLSEYPFMDKILSTQTGLIFLIRKDGAAFSASQFAYETRLAPKEPFILMDYYADAVLLSNILVEHPNMLEIDEKGQMVLPDGRAGGDFPFDLPLTEALKAIMPAFPAG